VTDGDEIIDLGHSEIVKLSKTESASLAIGGAQSAFVAEDLAGTLFERFQGIDLVGFQGPILAFEQGINLHEAGSGAVLAEAIDTPVVWDLLSEDFALNGASVLASQAEWSAALMRRMKEMGPVVHICLDARSQVFWVREGKLILATEAGPTMEFLLAKKAGVRGNIASGIPEQFVAGGFYSKMGPRASGQELSERAARAVQKMSAADARATAAAIVVAGVLQTLEQGPYLPKRVFVSGPVAADRDVASMLAAAINVPLESLGVNAMQAGGIGFVAARIVRGKTVTGPHVTGVPTTMSAGTLSRPSLS
jgi:anhydro-N-acetylmuramic acid kinase